MLANLPDLVPSATLHVGSGDLSVSPSTSPGTYVSLSLSSGIDSTLLSLSVISLNYSPALRESESSSNNFSTSCEASGPLSVSFSPGGAHSIPSSEFLDHSSSTNSHTSLAVSALSMDGSKLSSGQFSSMPAVSSSSSAFPIGGADLIALEEVPDWSGTSP